MNLVSGNRLWTNINNIPNKYTYLSEDENCDVAIIGGGIVGCICAWYFSKAGIDTILLDKNIIGYGSTCGSTSLLQYEIDFDLIELQDKIGLKNARRAFTLCNDAIKTIEQLVNDLNLECGYTRRECIYYTDKDKDIKNITKEYLLRKSNGFNVEYLDAGSSKDRFSFNLKAGIYTYGAAAEINPYLFSHGIVSKSIENGLRVYENTEISNILYNSDERLTLETNKYKTITCKKVLIATGYEARNYIGSKYLTLNRTYTLATKPVNEFNGWYNRCLIRDYKSPYNYLRSTDDSRIIIGGEDTPASGILGSIYSVLNDEKLAESKYSKLEQTFHSMFPEMTDVEIEYKFSGLFGETKDGLPYIGPHKNYPNHYFCLGYGSNGILYAITGAQLLRDLHKGQFSEDLLLYSFER